MKGQTVKTIEWAIALPNGRGCFCVAPTKSEARGAAKKLLGLRRKERLPKLTRVARTA